ncbi:MAG: hypothetical protein R3A46_06800 [Thermomicrobiales bacterium]
MGIRSWSDGGFRLLALLAAFAVAAGGYVAAFGLPGAGAAPVVSYTGCVSRYTGQMRVLVSGGSCSSSEVPISFGEAGPPGPPGPQGPPGPAGTLEAAIQTSYTGSSTIIPDTGTSIPFDTTNAAVGSNITHPTSTTFVVAESGVYKVEFILQGSVQGSTAQVRVNGLPSGPLFQLPTAVAAIGNEQQLIGENLLTLAAGDVIDIFAVGPAPPASTYTAGSTIILTQLTSLPPT